MLQRKLMVQQFLIITIATQVFALAVDCCCAQSTQAQEKTGALGTPAVSEAFRTRDTDGDGSLNSDEFVGGGENQNSAARFHRSRREQRRSAEQLRIPHHSIVHARRSAKSDR